jgi:hypothetical protein
MKEKIKGLHYNYDLEECNWMFKHGVKPIGCGKHDKTGNPFIVFLVNRRYKELESLYKEKTLI